METKVCNKCDVEKPLNSEFFSIRNDKNKITFRNDCKMCRFLYVKNRYKEKKDDRKKYQKQYGENNIEKLKKYQKEYRENNIEKRKEYALNYFSDIKNTKRKKDKSIAWKKKMKKENVLFKVKNNLSKRVWAAFTNGYKKGKTADMIGCSWEQLKLHIENQFQDGMTWDNWTIDGWHIDHIIPLASAKTEEELIKLNHYTNLQPLWAKDNLSKGAKII